MRLTALILAGILILPLPARGHTTEEKAEWKSEWTTQALKDGVLSIGELKTYLAFSQRHRPPIRLLTLASPPSTTSTAGNVEQWTPLLVKYFQPEDLEWARRVMWCESRGNPLAFNPTSAASGLFQHLQRYWADRSAKAGIPGADIFDSEANIAVASWLYYHGGGSRHWVCR